MRLIDFAIFLMDKCSYLIEHPYYGRTDIMLKEVVKEFINCTTKDEWNKIKKKSDLKISLKDIQLVSKKRREKKSKDVKRKENYGQLIDMYEAVINNIHNQLSHKEFIKNQQLIDKIKELESELAND